MATPLGARGTRRTSKSKRHTSGTARVEAALSEHRELISATLRASLASRRPVPGDDDPRIRALLDGLYGQMEYHFGWRDAALAPTTTNPGKLMRPSLVLLSARLFAEALGDGAEIIVRALPAAVAVEMVHNFSLIHDDIEDGDEVRRHRATLWRIWGQPQAINTGDALFAVARANLLDLQSQGVPAERVTLLAALLDQTCLLLCEGQYLEMSFEGKQDVSPAMYLAMIERKTAALMECATEMGARIGGADAAQARGMAAFGRALGTGFQLRDDLLGIWASDEQLGKRAAGDLRRKKMTLPIIYALEHASPDDQATLAELYAAAPPLDDTQVEGALAILDRTRARAHVRGILAEQCRMARNALAGAVPASAGSSASRKALAALVDFIEADAL